MTLYAERLLPHSIEAEEALLGSILIDGEAMAYVTPIVSAEEFYRERNLLIFDAATALFQRGAAIDHATLVVELARTERLDAIGGASYLSHLAAITPTSVHAEDYAEIVARTALMRRLIAAAARISELGYNDTDDVAGTMREAQEALFSVQPRTDGGLISGREAVDRYLQQKSEILGGDWTPPVFSGIEGLDYLTGGLRPGNVMVIGGRPGHGKSTLTMNMLRYALGNGKRAAYMSLENDDQETILRMVSHDTGINYSKLRNSLYTPDEEAQEVQALGVLSDLPFYLGIRRVHTMSDIRARAIQSKGLLGGLDLLLIDYLQLMRGQAGRGRAGYSNRVQELSEITRGLKELAVELEAPVVLASQLNRQIEGRMDHRPNIADLRDSGSIEQDADVVVFINRPALYGDGQEYDYPDGINPAVAAELLVAKNRHNAPGGTWCTFDGATMRIRQF